MVVLMEGGAVVDGCGSAGQGNQTDRKRLSSHVSKRLRSEGQISVLIGTVVVFHRAAKSIVSYGSTVGRGEIAVGVPGVGVEGIV